MTRILVVEDEASFSEALAYLLTKEGFEVSVAENGADAITEFARNGADLVLLRPDLHVCWRGDRAPAQTAVMAAIVTGRVAHPDWVQATGPGAARTIGATMKF